MLIYNCPDMTDVPLNVRASWIRDIYPNVEVMEAWDGPLEIGDTPQIKRMHEEYILRPWPEGGSPTFTQASSTAAFSQALGAENRLVDPSRAKLPVSGTMLRENQYQYRQFIHPRVYRDLITNVVFLGAPSTGKTTIAEKLAQEFGTVWMPEYGREYWDTHHVDRRLTLEQLTEIAEGHLERENALLGEANCYLFTDTNAQTTYIFSLYYHGKADKRLIDYANAASSRYDLVFCATWTFLTTIPGIARVKAIDRSFSSKSWATWQTEGAIFRAAGIG